MSQFLSPGVYVQEVPSAVQPIAGVGTSTAAFLGAFPDPVTVAETTEPVGIGDGRKKVFRLARYPADTTAGKFSVTVGSTQEKGASLSNDPGRGVSSVVFDVPPASGAISVRYSIQVKKIKNEQAIAATGLPGAYALSSYPVDEMAGSFSVRTVRSLSDATLKNAADGPSTVELKAEVTIGSKIRVEYSVQGMQTSDVIDVTAAGTSFPLTKRGVDDKGKFQVWEIDTETGVKLANDSSAKIARVIFDKAPANGVEVRVDYQVPESVPPNLAAPSEVKLCTSFADFKQWFGDFSNNSGQRNLAHAVYGFFLNGGTRCFVVREVSTAALLSNNTLDKLAAIDEIALVAAPGINDAAVWGAIEAHCKTQTGDRFGILDCAESADVQALSTGTGLPANTDYAAFYFPWLEVFDPFSGGRLFVPPSGHMAGIYARVDNARGVHKAPANETVMGALGLKYQLSKAQQDGLNPIGVNCIRNMNGNIKVWGARTIGGDLNGEWKYLSVRRLFLFLRESIDQGTQWVVFEPNDMSLWAKITRNITAFLTTVWRSGALFGNTPQEAFYVRCDATTNPPELRELGQVVTEIGVAVVKPAEFVVFRISQWAGPGQ